MSAVRERELERELFLMGTDVRMLVGPASDPGLPDPARALDRIADSLVALHDTLSRFRPESELSRLNRDPRRAVVVSPLLRVAIAAALDAARASGGLVDPTLLREIERAGYEESRIGHRPEPLAAALAAAPPRHPAAPRPEEAWRYVRLHGDTVVRPPGVALDLGGTAKGLAADLAGARLGGYASFAVDAGGDIRVGGRAGVPREVAVANPWGGEPVHAFRVTSGAVATSGIGRHLWWTSDGFAHHLLDPRGGKPAWTGVVQATALASSAARAEALAKAALLSGPSGGASVLERAAGGVLVLDDGSVEVFGADR